MAGLVHHESTRLIDQIRRICIAQRENIVVEGTLSWRGQAPRLVTELAQGDYQRVEVIAIDADRTTCHEQALARWWRGRRRWVGAPICSAAASLPRPRSTSASRIPNFPGAHSTPSSSPNSPQRPSATPT
ncbi:zeta toxin family protein [Speluncibacter jeojiensis]|uniref:UDP-N-acetylglucosamine kinase n=1 Tax=Speluncibacter jeojiensis TaxID=2710754 RepID=A0A9X4M4U5_9ACTN|nr:zeta toxin family protein [Corynebacteriales bacterium D3-21]